jgi:hypothetical protein
MTDKMKKSGNFQGMPKKGAEEQKKAENNIIRYSEEIKGLYNVSVSISLDARTSEENIYDFLCNIAFRNFDLQGRVEQWRE